MKSKITLFIALGVPIALAIAFAVALRPMNSTSARIAEAEARTTSGFARIEEAREAQVEAQQKTEQTRIKTSHEINRIWATAGANEMTEDGSAVRRMALADLLANEEWRHFGMITLFFAVVGSVTGAAYSLARFQASEAKCDQCTYQGCDRSATYKAVQASYDRRRVEARLDTRPLEK